MGPELYALGFCLIIGFLLRLIPVFVPQQKNWYIHVRLMECILQLQAKATLLFTKTHSYVLIQYREE